MEHVEEIFTKYEPYASMSRSELSARIYNAYVYGNLIYGELSDGTEMAFTWMRPTGNSVISIGNGYTPHPSDWEQNGPRVWIVDFAASKRPSFGSMVLGRAIGHALVCADVCEDGEAVFFRRSNRGRLGMAIARGY